MPAKKKAVTTPLHLLQQLSNSLVVHLEKACTDAQKDAEILLAKLEKQRGKTQEKLIRARARLDDAGNAGKSKSQTKARSKLAELDDMFALLQSRQSETLSYLADLKRDAEQALTLAQGVTQVEQAAAEALASRNKTARSRSASTQRTATSAKVGQEPIEQASDDSSPAPAKRASATRVRPATSKLANNKLSATSASSGSASTGSDETQSPARPATSRTKPKPTAKAGTAAEPASAAKPATKRKAAATRKAGTAKSDSTAQSTPSASS